MIKEEQVKNMCDELYAYLVKFRVYEKNGLFYAFCPGISGVNVTGYTKDEALETAKGVCQTIIDINTSSGDIIPENEHVIHLRESISTKELKAPPYKDSVIMPAHIAHQNLECDQHA